MLCLSRVSKAHEMGSESKELCAPLHQVIDGGISGCWECEGHNDEREECGDNEGEFHVG